MLSLLRCKIVTKQLDSFLKEQCILFLVKLLYPSQLAMCPGNWQLKGQTANNFSGSNLIFPTTTGLKVWEQFPLRKPLIHGFESVFFNAPSKEVGLQLTKNLQVNCGCDVTGKYLITFNEDFFGLLAMKNMGLLLTATCLNTITMGMAINFICMKSPICCTLDRILLPYI